MTEHVSTSLMKRFCVRALPIADLTAIAEHLAGCTTCHQQFTETLRSRRGQAPLKFTLAPEFWFRHEHVDYEQLVGMADNTLDTTEREIIDIHLKVCTSCKEDVRSFLAFREQMVSEAEVSDMPASPQPLREKPSAWVWWRALAWKPAYVAAVVVLGIAIVIAVVVMKRRAANLEAIRTPLQNNNAITGQTPTPENRPASKDSAAPAPVPSNELLKPSPTLTVKNREPVKQSENAGAVVVLNDGRATVTVDKAGDISGLDDIPVERRREIAEALIAERIETPEIIKELSGPETTLRGGSSGQPFKLLSPARTVIITDRPSFEWEKLPGATSYRVLVGDLKGHEIAKSEELSPARTSWTPPVPLKRGEIYSWAVIAVVEGKEIVSPGSSAPEMKFQILPSQSLHELNQLKRTHSHLALGIFYAKVGMISEAEREFQELLRLNPSTKVTSSLLRSLRLLSSTER